MASMNKILNVPEIFGIDVFNDADTHFLLEDMGNVFFVVSQLPAHVFQRKVVVGKVIVQVLFDYFDSVMPFMMILMIIYFFLCG